MQTFQYTELFLLGLTNSTCFTTNPLLFPTFSHYVCMLFLPKDNDSVHNLPHTPRPGQTLVSAEEEWQDQVRHNRARSPSPSTSDYEDDRWEDVQPGFRDCGGTVNDGNRSDWRRPMRSHSGQNHRTSTSQSGWGNVVQLIKDDLNEQGYSSYAAADELFKPVYELERILSRRHSAIQQPENRLTRHSSMRVGHSRAWQDEGAGRRPDGRLVRRFRSFKSRSGGSQRRVHFQDDWQRNVDNDDRRRGGIQAGRKVQIDRRGSLHEVSRTYSTDDFQETNRVRRYPVQEEQRPGSSRESEWWEGHSSRVRRESRPSVQRREELESRSYHGGHGGSRGGRWAHPEEISSTEDEDERESGRWREERRDSRPSHCRLAGSSRGRSPRAGNPSSDPLMCTRSLAS